MNEFLAFMAGLLWTLIIFVAFFEVTRLVIWLVFG